MNETIVNRHGSAQDREKCIVATMEKAGWSREKAEARIDAAVERLDIDYDYYNWKDFCLLTAREQDRKHRQYLLQQEQREKCIQYAMREMGWSRPLAIRMINDARRRIKVTYFDYRDFRLARIKPDQQEINLQNGLKRRKAAKEETERCYAKICEATGWDRNTAEEKVKKAQELTGCAVNKYYAFRFWELTEEEQNAIYLHRTHLEIRRRYPYDKKLKRIVESKELTNRYFSKYLVRPWCVNEETSLEEFKEMFKNSTGVVYKPVFGLQGRGVEAFRFDEVDPEAAYNIIKDYERGVVEELVVQNKVMNQFNPKCVNTIRILSISSSTKAVTADGRKMDIATATVKLGGGSTVVDNLHLSGGVCAAVNLETGEIMTDGVGWDGEVHETHPCSGVTIKGKVLPYVKEAQEMIYDAIRTLQLEGVIGWDIAIGENGPVLIEPNVNPDMIFVNLPYVKERKGMKPYMMKYLW